MNWIVWTQLWYMQKRRDVSRSKQIYIHVSKEIPDKALRVINELTWTEISTNVEFSFSPDEQRCGSSPSFFSVRMRRDWKSWVKASITLSKRWLLWRKLRIKAESIEIILVQGIIHCMNGRFHTRNNHWHCHLSKALSLPLALIAHGPSFEGDLLLEHIECRQDEYGRSRNSEKKWTFSCIISDNLGGFRVRIGLLRTCLLSSIADDMWSWMRLGITPPPFLFLSLPQGFLHRTFTIEQVAG